MRTCGRLDDGEAEAATASITGAGRVGPVEALERSGSHRVGHARTLVDHLEHRTVVLGTKPNID